MNIKQLSKSTGIPYSTARKYLAVLVQNNLISLSKDKSGTVEIDDGAQRVFVSFVEHIRSGETPSEAIKKMAEENLSKDDALSLLIEKMERLEDENRKLREIVQVYLSKVENIESRLKELMPPKKNNLFSRILKRIKKSS